MIMEIVVIWDTEINCLQTVFLKKILTSYDDTPTSFLIKNYKFVQIRYIKVQIILLVFFLCLIAYVQWSSE